MQITGMAVRACVWTAFAIAVAVTPQAEAQPRDDRRAGSACVDSESLLTLLVWERAEHGRGKRAEAEIGRILMRADLHSPQTVLSIMDGLERLALTASAPRVRSGSAVLLSTAGDRDLPSPVPSTARRLIRLYRATDDPGLQAVLMGLPFTRQAERTVIAEFLGAIAVDEPRPEPHPNAWDDVAAHAIGNLTLLGEEGRRVLRGLHAQGSVRSPRARQMLASLAEQSFRRSP